jgi:hypothetical protein
MAVTAEIDEDLASRIPSFCRDRLLKRGPPAFLHVSLISTLQGAGQCFCSTCLSFCLPMLDWNKREKDISTETFDSRLTPSQRTYLRNSPGRLVLGVAEDRVGVRVVVVLKHSTWSPRKDSQGSHAGRQGSSHTVSCRNLINIKLDSSFTRPRYLFAPSCAFLRKWMESDPFARFSNGSASEARVGAPKYGLDTNTSPSDQQLSNDNNHYRVTSPVTSPPYWVQSHQRSFSNISVESIPDGAITLQDNEDGEDAKNKACWARSVYIEDYVIINGSRTGIGAFVVWNITVDTLHVGLTPQLLGTSTNKNRVVRCAFAKDTQNSTTCGINFFELSPIRQRRCLPCRQRALYLSFAQNSWRTEGLDYNTFSSGLIWSP